MISAPNSYFTTEEAKKTGAEAKFFYAIHPFYFLSGIGAGAGTFTNCSFAAPERITVDYQAGSASWLSPVMSVNLDSVPVNVTASWSIVSAGYNAVIEYRTAPTYAAVSSASWVAMTINNSYPFYGFYQWRVTWNSLRGWAFDTEDADPTQAYALDTVDYNDQYLSYASASEDAPGASYIDLVRFTGEYQVSSGDIVDGGSLTLQCPTDFSDLVSGDHTLTLSNVTGKFSPGNSNFIFSGELYWYLKGLRVDLGYRRPGTNIWDKITVYDGMIIDWGPVHHAVGQDGKPDPHTAQIYSRDRVAWLLDKKIGVPLADGTPNPVVSGDAFRQVDQLTDQMVGAPVLSATFEAGNLSEFTVGTDTSVGGTIAVSTANPYSGAYCCRTTVANANAYSVGKIGYGVGINRAFCSFAMCVNTFPATPSNKLAYFLGVYGGSDWIQFRVATDGHVVINYNGTEYDSTWYIDDYAGSYRRVTVGIYSNTNPGMIKVSVDGSEVFTKSDLNLTGKTWQNIYFGPVNGASAESYSIDFDDIKLWNDFIPQLYQLRGYPYTSIDQVYIDGSIRVEQTADGVASRIISGRTPNASVITTSPQYGAIAFTDLANPPSGTISVRAKHDTIQHPVDIIQGILTLAGVASYIDTANFTAAKVALPNDLINTYFEDTTAGDALRAIVQNCLINLFMDHGQIRLAPYKGTAPASYVMALDEGDIDKAEEKVSQADIQNKTTGKWGWYEHSKTLYYEANDLAGQAYLGVKSTDLDFSWGSTIASESQAMVKQKVDWLLTRLKAAKDILTMSGPLSLARLEIGDTVQVNVPFLRNATIFTVFTKTLNMKPPYGVELELYRFLGE